MNKGGMSTGKEQTTHATQQMAKKTARVKPRAICIERPCLMSPAGWGGLLCFRASSGLGTSLKDCGGRLRTSDAMILELDGDGDGERLARRFGHQRLVGGPFFFFFFLLNVEKEGGRSRDDSVGESWRIAHKMGDAWPGETDEVDDKGSWRVERLSV